MAAHLQDEWHASRRAARALESAELVARATRAGYRSPQGLLARRPRRPAPRSSAGDRSCRLALSLSGPLRLATVDATPATEIAPAARPARRQAASGSRAARRARTSGAALRVRYDASGRTCPQAYAYAAARPLRWIDPNGEMILPPDPSGLGSDWVVDPTHEAPNGLRLRHPSGWYLDFDSGGKGGPKGRNAAGSGPHWHLNGGKRHLRPGTEVDDPPEHCEDQGDEQSVDVEDEQQGNDYYRALADCDVMDFACRQGVQHILWLPIFISPAQLAPIFGGAAVEGPLVPAAEAAWAY